MADDAELYELVSSPSTQLLANCVRVVLAFAGIAPSSVRDAVLDGAALSDYVAGARSGSGLPAFVDYSKRVEINRPLALLRYVARLGGVEGSGGADAERAALAAEAVVAYLPAGLSGDAPTATLFLGELEVLLAQFAGAQTRLTYGDALVWYAATCAERVFGPGVFDAAPGMRALSAALNHDARIVDAARAVGCAAATPPSRPVQSAAAVKGPILVSGASGFIASWVVAILLQRGYTVHATVRRLGDGARHDHLRALPGAEGGRLRLFEADLLAPGSFAAAVAGCSGAIHCASPFFFAPKADAHEELIRPAVEGTQNVLRACIAEATVQRVVMTSSVAACYVSRAAADHWYTEAQWSDLGLIRETKQHYAESKLLAEREAWRLIEEESPPGRGLSLVTILPTQTLGPLLQPVASPADVNQSCAVVLEYLTAGKKTFPRKGKCFVDVRDAATAHVLALEDGAAEGRYLLIAQSAPWRVFASELRDAVPWAPVPSVEEEGPPGHPQAQSSLLRTHGLFARAGLCYPTPVETSIRDCALSLVEKGLVPRPPAAAAPPC